MWDENETTEFGYNDNDRERIAYRHTASVSGFRVRFDRGLGLSEVVWVVPGLIFHDDPHTPHMIDFHPYIIASPVLPTSLFSLLPLPTSHLSPPPPATTAVVVVVVVIRSSDA